MSEKLDANRLLLLVFIIAVVVYTWWGMNMGHDLEAQDKHVSISSLQCPILTICLFRLFMTALTFNGMTWVATVVLSEASIQLLRIVLLSSWKMCVFSRIMIVTKCIWQIRVVVLNAQ